MKEIIEKEFGIVPVEIKKLNGYENLNYLVRTKTEHYVFKTYPHSTSISALIEAENDALLFLQNDFEEQTPKPIAYIDGSYIKNIEINGVLLTCRLLSFMTGQFKGDLKTEKAMSSSLGSFLANLNLALMDFENPILQYRKCEWDIQQLPLNRKYIKDI